MLGPIRVLCVDETRLMAANIAAPCTFPPQHSVNKISEQDISDQIAEEVLPVRGALKRFHEGV
jgi:hypothetical protein